MPVIARPLLAACLVMLGLVSPAAAQAPALPPGPEAARQVDLSVQPGPANQTIQRIRTEDAGSRIDELRVGGETQSISVQPKNDMPAYEVRPSDARGGGQQGMRLWNFLKF